MWVIGPGTGFPAATCRCSPILADRTLGTSGARLDARLLLYGHATFINGEMIVMAQELVVKERVRQYLTDLLGSVEVDNDGDFHFQMKSTRVFVGVTAWGDDETVVRITAPVLLGAPASPELFRYVATHADDYVFGHLCAEEGDEGVIVLLAHRLLGDTLDPPELKNAVGGIAVTANNLDDDLVDLFGGSVFHPDA